MESNRSLTYPVKIFYGCYKIIENFMSRVCYYCLCNLNYGCQTKVDCMAGARYNCNVCRVLNHYSIEELHEIRRNNLILTRFYLKLLEDLCEIKKINFDFDFWDDEVEFKFRYWKTGKGGRSFLRDSIEFL